MSQKLKVDLHTHTSEDPKDCIAYSSFELISKASEEGFDAIAITNHNVVTYSKELERYAEKKDILLLPGIEATLSKKHVLIINPDPTRNLSARTLQDLPKLKDDMTLVIAPHPFFPAFKSLRSEFFSFLPFFDALEFSYYYNHMFNLNKKAVFIAEKYDKPLVGASDCHNLWQLGTTFTLVEAEKDILCLIQAVKNGKIEIRASPLSLATMTRVAINCIFSDRLRIPFRL